MGSRPKVVVSKKKFREYEDLEELYTCEKCESTFERYIDLVIHEERHSKSAKLDFVSTLEKLSRCNGLGKPDYKLVREQVARNKTTFWIGLSLEELGISVLGSGKPKLKASKQNAAHKMLSEIMRAAQTGNHLNRINNKKLLECREWITKKA